LFLYVSYSEACQAEHINEIKNGDKKTGDFDLESEVSTRTQKFSRVENIKKKMNLYSSTLQ